MQSPELPLLSPELAETANTEVPPSLNAEFPVLTSPQVRNIEGNRGPIPANDLARLQRHRLHQQSVLQKLLKLAVLAGFIVLMIMVIAVIILGAITQVQRRDQIILIMMKHRAQSASANERSIELPSRSEESEAEELAPTRTSNASEASTRTVRVVLPKKLPKKERGGFAQVERIITLPTNKY